MAPVNLVIRGCALHPELTIIILWCMRSIQNWISIKKRIRLAWKKVCRDIFLPRVILWVYIKKPNNKAHTSINSYFGRLILRQAQYNKEDTKAKAIQKVEWPSIY